MIGLIGLIGFIKLISFIGFVGSIGLISFLVLMSIPLSPGGSCQDGTVYVLGTGSFEDVGALIESVSRGRHIVHEDDCSPLDHLRIHEPKCLPDILASLVLFETGLRLGVFYPSQG